MPTVPRSELEVESRRVRRGDGRSRPGGGRGEVPPREEARARILETAYRLFSRHGINAVGVDRIVAEAPVAKATLYHHFPSKQDLVCSFLELREARWTVEWLQAEVERLAAAGTSRALAVFDALDEWFHQPDYEGCSFINTLLEIDDPENPIHQMAVRQLDAVRRILEEYAVQSGARRPVELSYQLQLLMMGAIVAASRGDSQAARRARALAELLLARATRARGASP
jgi:AcrR family transcriptional regulator